MSEFLGSRVDNPRNRVRKVQNCVILVRRETNVRVWNEINSVGGGLLLVARHFGTIKI